MSMSNKHKCERMLDKSAVAGWLRDLATDFDRGELAGEAGAVSLEGFKGLKLSIKPAFDGKILVKLSVKFPKATTGAQTEDDDDESDALPKYSSLKKHMKQTFKAIGAALAAGQLPPALEAQSFIADSKLMVSYPGKGDEFYKAYLEKTNAFEAALAISDLETLKAVHSELAQLKRDCHSRYA
ncbi:MAG: GAK system XXXCH domain-containing protein [Desulfovibrio sp.]|nr:GAK system XXXCH domain-containing protein [Desulfovibrio sp.]